MKSLNVFIALLFIVITASAQDSFQIKGSFTGINKPSRVIMNYRSLTKYKNDTALISANGEFTLKGQIDKPIVVTLYLQELNVSKANARNDYANLYAEPGDIITVKGANLMKTAEIKGGPIQAEYSVLQDSLQPINSIFDNLTALIRSNLIADDTKKQLRKTFQDIYSVREDIETRFIASHPSSFVSWEIVAGRSAIIDIDKFEPAFNSLSPELRQKPEGIALQKRLEIAKKLKIGNPAIEFTINDPNGNPISLASYKGKYVLVDFWASWCGPCRAENPHMLKAYTNLKDKNFEILGVSLDDNKEKWLKAIEDDKLPWKQVSDLKGFNSIAQIYGIRAIPQNYLINPEGNIIAKDLRGAELESLLRKAMNL